MYKEVQIKSKLQVHIFQLNVFNYYVFGGYMSYFFNIDIFLLEFKI
jgi:hypothetical protein